MIKLIALIVFALLVLYFEAKPMIAKLKEKKENKN